ncbi:Bacterial regulatory protein, MarR [mine drainage metagenome]|uniref:Bacterial regulatory protein, MarR n=1 Tax=mine drainage metagenome TaxID=410659 RepID=T0Z0Z1_9ZZZZ
MNPKASRTAVPPQELPWHLLREAYFLLREEWTDHLDRFDLSLSDSVVLELCARNPARASEIARAIGITPAGATYVIDQLEGRRLVRRVADPKDRRVVLIRLAPAGRRLYREAKSTKRITLRYLNDAMSVEERRALATGLAALTHALRRDAHRTGGGG